MTHNQIETENAKAMHFLLGPVRLMEGIVKFLGWTMIHGLLCFYNTCGWVVGWGANGSGKRSEVAVDFNSSGTTYNVDFAHPSHDLTQGITYTLSSAISLRDMTEGRNLRYREEYVIRVDDAFIQKDVVISGAIMTKRPDALALRDWNPWSRSATSFRRKSARLERAFIIGEISATQLRTTLAQIKDRGIFTAQPIPGCKESGCSLARLESHSRSTGSIQLLHAPVLAVHYADIPGSDTSMKDVHVKYEGYDGYDGYAGIIGMRLINSINQEWESAYYKVDKYADLFWTKLPDYQPQWSPPIRPMVVTQNPAN